MKSFVVGLAMALALSSSAYAQSPGSEPSGYVSFVAQSAFSDVTSRSLGVEGGWSIQPRLMLFAELGQVRDTAPATIGPAAQVIAAYLTQVQSSPVSYSVKQPVGFGAVGVRFIAPYKDDFHLYVLGAGGVAKVKRDVRFTVGSTDVTETLATYGVVLGSDLAGTESKGMITGGGGITWEPKSRLFLDLGYRFSRILTEVSGTSISRVGLGIGVTF